MSIKVLKFLESSNAKDIITSLGMAIILPDGENIYRGSIMYIPESKVQAKVAVNNGDIDSWARHGWVDLRPANFQTWKDRSKRMLAFRSQKFAEGSAAVGPERYTSKTIKTGEVVGWILSTEFDGSRRK